MKRLLRSFIIIFILALGTLGLTSAFFSDTETSSGNILAAGAIDLKIDNTSYYNGVFNPGTSWEYNDLTSQLFFDFDDLKPGDIGEDTISIHVNDNDAWACMDVTLTKNIDNTCTDPERIDDQNCIEGNGENATNSGELAQSLNFIWWADDGDNVLEDDEEVFKQNSALSLFNGSPWTIADSEGSLWSEGAIPLTGGEEYFIGKGWCFGTLTTDALPQDGKGKVIVDDVIANGPDTRGEGFLCDGSGVNNAAQTDIVNVDVSFSAIQSRNNLTFVCGENGGGLPCQDKADVMLVLDRSASINNSELATLKSAATSFVTALSPSADGVHIGQTSFATTGSLDQHLTDNALSVNAAINALAQSGFTNLKEGIELASTELANPGDGHDREDDESPDFMVIITDGVPNRPLPENTADDLAAAAAATARANGTTIYVVGVGSDVNAGYLQNLIASSPAHYFAADDFGDLAAILAEIAEECPLNGQP